MFSLLEGPQQSAPTAVALAAAAPAAEAVTGSVSSPLCRRRVWRKRPRRQWARHRRQYLQQRRRPAVLFSPLRRWWGGAGRPLLQMEQRHRWRHRRPAVPFPRLHQLGGQPGRASRLLERRHRTRQRRRHRRPAILLPLMCRWRGRLESLRQQLSPLVKSAARGGRPPTPLIPVPCFHWKSATTKAAGCSMAVAAVVTVEAAAAVAEQRQHPSNHD